MIANELNALGSSGDTNKIVYKESYISDLLKTLKGEEISNKDEQEYTIKRYYYLLQMYDTSIATYLEMYKYNKIINRKQLSLLILLVLQYLQEYKSSQKKNRDMEEIIAVIQNGYHGDFKRIEHIFDEQIKQYPEKEEYYNFLSFTLKKIYEHNNIVQKKSD